MNRKKFLSLTTPSYLETEFGIAKKYAEGLRSTLLRLWAYGNIENQDDLNIQILSWIYGMERIGVKVDA